MATDRKPRATVVVIIYERLSDNKLFKIVVPGPTEAVAKMALMRDKRNAPDTVRTLYKRNVRIDLYNAAVGLFHLFHYEIAVKIPPLLRPFLETEEEDEVTSKFCETIMATIKEEKESARKRLCQPLFLMVGEVDRAMPITVV